MRAPSACAPCVALPAFAGPESGGIAGRGQASAEGRLLGAQDGHSPSAEGGPGVPSAFCWSRGGAVGMLWLPREPALCNRAGLWTRWAGARCLPGPLCLGGAAPRWVPRPPEERLQEPLIKPSETMLDRESWFIHKPLNLSWLKNRRKKYFF